MLNPTAPSGPSLLHEQAHLLARALPFMVAAELCTAVAIGWLLLETPANPTFLGLWLVAVAAIGIWRLRSTYRLRRDLLNPHTDSRPINRQLAGFCLLGALLFSIATPLLIPAWPVGGSATLWLFGTLLLGLAILGGSIYAANFKLASCYVLLLALPPCFFLALGALAAAQPSAALPAPLLTALLLLSSFRVHKLVVGALSSELRNRSLIQFLEGARNDAEQINAKLTREMAKRHQIRLKLQQAKEQLEQLVDARTQELKTSNDELLTATQRLELALTTSGIAMWDWDLTRDYTYQSNMAELLGYQAATVSRSSQVLALMHPDDFAATHANVVDHLKGLSDFYHCTYRVKHADGSWRWIEDHGQVVVRNAANRALRMIGTRRDVSAAHQADEQSRLAAIVFDNASEGIFIFDTQLNILAANDSFTRISGYSEAELLGHSLLHKPHGERYQAYSAIHRQLLADDFWEGEITEHRKNGEAYPEWLRINGVYNRQRQLTHYVGMISDLTELKRNAERLKFLSGHDPLTGLANRIRFNETLQRHLTTARLRRSRLALLCININRFKPINDSLGHDTGDQVLQQCAQRLRACLDDADQVARIDGDEFALLLNYGDKIEVDRVCQQVIEHLHAPLNLDRQELLLDISVGVSLFPANGEDVRTLLSQADSAMHRAKHNGGNTFSYYHADMSTSTREQLSLETSLKKALDRHEFEIYYQPKVRLTDDAISGAEALIRWHHPTRGLLTPASFIPLAEETGLITAIGEWVLFEACRQAMVWQQPGSAPITVAVNLSAQQFRSCDLVALVSDALESSGLPANLLKLELTESLLMDDLDSNINTLQQLRQLGVGLSLDDFGTGYSSLSYLRRFPIDELKIDRAFITDMAGNPEAGAIIHAIISMAHSLKLRVVAEGIETPQQRQQLHAMGCDTIQGYLIGKPLPAASLEQRLKAQHPQPYTSA